MLGHKVRLLTCERTVRYERRIRTVAWLVFGLPAVWVRHVLDDPVNAGDVLLVRYLGVTRGNRVVQVAQCLRGGRVVWYRPEPSDRLIVEDCDG